MTIISALMLMVAAQGGGVCDSAMTQTEMNMCSARAYQRADNALNQAWRGVTARIRSRGGSITSLRNAQRGWIRSRDNRCNARGGRYSGGSMEPFVRNMCLREVTVARTRQLNAMYR